jgi:hypothetical protein
MASMHEAMATRAVGQYPISVATSLALESAFGHYPDKPVVIPPPVTQVKNIWFNVRTLIRNFHGALAPEYQEKIKPEELLEGLIMELSMIEQVMAAQTQGYVIPVFYHCDYSRIIHQFSSAWLKFPKTPKQRHYAELEDKTSMKLLEAPISQPIRRFNYQLQAASGQFAKAFLVSHYPIDLLSRYNFQALSLLESHTGNIKGPAQWNTKLTNGKEHPDIPFNRFTLQVFGDGGNHFMAAPQRYREMVLNMAKLDHWTAVTTLERVRFSLGHVHNDVDRATLIKLL